MIERRRAADKGAFCWLARRASEMWEFIDNRQIDAHIVAAVIIFATLDITAWAMRYAETADRPGLEVAAVIGAVMVPWGGLQAAVIKWYFEARK